MFVVPVSRRPASAYRSLDRLLDSSFERFVHSVARPHATARTPALDVTESDTQFVATLDLPGVAKSDVKIAIDGRRISIEAQRPAPAEQVEAPAATDAASTTPAARVIHRERDVVSYSRSFVLPVEVDQASSQARLEDGVLSLTLAKRAPTASQLTVS